MDDLKRQWKGLILSSLAELIKNTGGNPEPLELKDIVVETPPKPEYGDLAFPMFPYAKILRQAPPQIASKAAELLNSRIGGAAEAEITVLGAYINVKLNIGDLTLESLEKIRREGSVYGRNDTLKGQRIMVEFSCPNTNKPLHLGHLRNDALGESISRILAYNGAEVRKVNLINDRGIHICKSMLAYKKFGQGSTPETEGIKSDHFVGNYYVKYDKWSKEEPAAEEQARDLLRAWEQGDPEVTKLWELMNRWAIEGIEETYRKTGVSFDAVYFESKTYSLGREEVLKGLEKGVFYKEGDGSIWVDLEEIKLDKKVLLRKDGTSLYLTQDIGTAIYRHRDWAFDRLVYVVASEQQYHFKVLFYVLEKLGYPWAKALYHLSYGMVNLPEGRMKSREGTVVDADDLLAELIDLAKQEIREKGREGEVDDLDLTAYSVALGALSYFLLQANPSKDMIFNPQESLSFNGNTGPYLQYMGARISSMLRKYGERVDNYTGVSVNPDLLKSEDERELIKLVSAFPAAVKQSADSYNPSIVAGYLYELCKVYSRFYHDSPILHNQDKEMVVTRVSLSEGVLQVLRNGFSLLGIPFLEKM